MNQTAQNHRDETPAANVRHDGMRTGEHKPRHESFKDEDLDLDLGDEADLGEATVRVLARLRQRIREQPLTAATGALIVGFAIGNGVPKFLARAGIGIGLRFVMGRIFERALLGDENEL